MNIFPLIVFIIAAVVSYLVSGINPAIVLSTLIYKKDIRNEGSKNPGFTNFKRVFGSKYAWWVFVLDLLKAAVICFAFGALFNAMGLGRMLGVAIAGVFAILGHAYPCWYGFKGGKGFLVALSTAWFLDWRAGLAATLVMVVLLLTLRFMSLATLAGLTCGAVVLFVLSGMSLLPPESHPLAAAVLYALCVLFVIYRHKANIVRLINGTESKTNIIGKK